MHAGLELRRDGLPLALWNRDVAAAMPDGNIYGSWPFYMDIRSGERPPRDVNRAAVHADMLLGPLAVLFAVRDALALLSALPSHMERCSAIDRAERRERREDIARRA
jgi:hypothetical protein